MKNKYLQAIETPSYRSATYFSSVNHALVTFVIGYAAVYCKHDVLTNVHGNHSPLMLKYISYTRNAMFP